MLTNEQLEALATVHLHPQTQAGGEVDLMPLLRAVEDAATEQATARQNASWRLMCEQMVAADRARVAKLAMDHWAEYFRSFDDATVFADKVRAGLPNAQAEPAPTAQGNP